MDEAVRVINRERKGFIEAVLAGVLKSTELPKVLVFVALQYLPSSYNPPSLEKEVKYSSNVPDRIVDEVSSLITGDGLDKEQCFVQSVSRNPQHLHGFLKGPECSPFAGGLFQIEIKIPEEYPKVAPRLNYLTPIHHENIDNSGSPNLRKMLGPWCDTYDLKIVLKALQTQLMLVRADNEEQLKKETREHAMWPSNAKNMLGNSKHWNCINPLYRHL
ncbi:hypothetical protein AAMO2058_000711900 [Amorphochlora amoebiformis]